MLNATILLIPVLLLISAAEWWISVRREKEVYSGENFAMNLAIGAIDQVFSLIYFTALYFALDFVYRHSRFIELQDRWYTWIAAYVLVDFISYWYHRFSHRVNILWAGHVTHHSSEHYNFSNGFRTSFFQGINRILFWSIMPVFGFSPVMLVLILKVSGLYDFLLHTTFVPKLGFLEKIFVTPSQHRVHHGRNEQYLDKNYGSTFVIWDKLFGTFREETEEVEYGIKGNYTDNNPYHAISYYYRYLWQVMQTTPGFAAKLRLLFIPPDRTPKPQSFGVRSAEYGADPIKSNSGLRTPGSKLFPSLPVAPALRNYAWSQIAWAAAGLLMMLLFVNYLPAINITAYAFIGVLTISGAAMTLNGNFRENLVRAETGRLLLSMLLLVGVFGLKPKLYILLIGIFPLLSMFYFQLLKDRESMVMG